MSGPSLSPASDLAHDLHHDPNPRSPKRQRTTPEKTSTPPTMAPIVPVARSRTVTPEPVATATSAVPKNHSSSTIPVTGPAVPSSSKPSSVQDNQSIPQSSTETVQRTFPSSVSISHSTQSQPTITSSTQPLPNNTQPRSTTVSPAGPTGGPAQPPTMSTSSQQATTVSTSVNPQVQQPNPSSNQVTNSNVQIPPQQLQQHPRPISSGAQIPSASNAGPATHAAAQSRPNVAPAVPIPSAAPKPDPLVERRKSQLANLGQLDDLAGQILSLLVKMPVVDVMSLDSDMRLLASGQQPASPAPAEYQRLRTLFDPIRNLYLTGSPFLIAEHLNLTEPSQIASLRKANQAMYCCACFAGGIGQLALDQGFLDVFVPMNGYLLQSQVGIWVELKTQAFMTAMRSKAAGPSQVMHDLFPTGIENRILARRPHQRQLSPSELDFIKRFQARRALLQDHVDRNALPDLDKLYPYQVLAGEVRNHLLTTKVVSRRSGGASASQTASPAPQGQSTDQTASGPSNSSVIAGSATLPSTPSAPSRPNLPSATDIPVDVFEQMCARAFQQALIGTPLEGLEPAAPQHQTAPNPSPTSQLHSQPTASGPLQNNSPHPASAQNNVGSPATQLTRTANQQVNPRVTNPSVAASSAQPTATRPQQMNGVGNATNNSMTADDPMQGVTQTAPKQETFTAAIKQEPPGHDTEMGDRGPGVGVDSSDVQMAAALTEATTSTA